MAKAGKGEQKGVPVQGEPNDFTGFEDKCAGGKNKTKAGK